MTLVLNWVSLGPSEFVPSGPHLDLVTLVPTWASSGHGSSAWPAVWPHLDLVSGFVTWASLMPSDTGPHVGLTWTWYLWSLTGHHRDIFPLHGLQVGLSWTW